MQKQNRIQSCGEESRLFEWKSGVGQKPWLSPKLFTFAVDDIMKRKRTAIREKKSPHTVVSRTMDLTTIS